MTKIVSVSLSHETRDALEAEAKRQKRSRSWVVREALAEYVANRRDQGVMSPAAATGSIPALPPALPPARPASPAARTYVSP
ncbi:CopG family transcriptional regulator [bacterium]|nr:CopG family transcriptional regulator [bacterium]